MGTMSRAFQKALNEMNVDLEAFLQQIDLSERAVEAVSEKIQSGDTSVLRGAAFTKLVQEETEHLILDDRKRLEQ